MNLHSLPTEHYAAQLGEKQQRLQALLEPFAAPALECFDSPREHYRMRAEFRIWHDEGDCCYAMFEPGQKASSQTLIRLAQFPTAGRAINALMQPLLSAIKAQAILQQRLFTIEFLSTLSGDMLVTLIYHKKLDEHWEAAAQGLQEQFGIAIIGRSRGQKQVLSRDYVLERFTVQQRQYTYRQIEGGFTQPNARVCEKMLNWAVDCATDLQGDLLELYCGNGNFTLPLSTRFDNTLATEISKTSVQAAQWNIETNQLDRIRIVRLSSEEFTQAYTGAREFVRLQRQAIDLSQYQFSTVLVDPPRAGVDADTLQLLQQFTHILYISCNPDTLQANLHTLCQSHRIVRAALFDQFPYTHHIESGVLLTRR